MLILAIDSSATASVTLGELSNRAAGAEVQILAHRETQDTRSHAEVMSVFVRDVLTEAQASSKDIEGIVTGTGPGPFTGLRAGIVTARTLSFALATPLYGLMSLNSIAENAWSDAQTRGYSEFLVAADARRREIYSATFATHETGYELIDGPRVGAATEVPALPAYGFGAGLYREQLEAVKGYTELHANSRGLLEASVRIGLENLSTDTQALYLRESDAKVPQARKKATHVAR